MPRSAAAFAGTSCGPGTECVYLVHPHMQVSLDGGPFHPCPSAAYDPQHGCEAERTALLAAASGTCADQHMSAGADLSVSLQRLWVLVEATAELLGAETVLSGRTRGPGAAERLNAAMKTLFVVSEPAAAQCSYTWLRD
jgi:hypothetical protein